MDRVFWDDSRAEGHPTDKKLLLYGSIKLVSVKKKIKSNRKVELSDTTDEDKKRNYQSLNYDSSLYGALF